MWPVLQCVRSMVVELVGCVPMPPPSHHPRRCNIGVYVDDLTLVLLINKFRRESSFQTCLESTLSKN